MKIRKVAVVMVLVFSSFAASNVAPSKAELEAMYGKAYRAFDSNNFGEALRQLDELDARQADVAESQNLRGVIYMRQGMYNKAEMALQEAVRIDPKFWNARFNLAEIPFLKKEWVQARERFQQLLSSNVSELQGEAAQLIQYKILLTYLLEGKENMVDSILAKFELSPDTPAVHYANAAIAFQRNNAREAEDWLATANKNFSPQLNKLFSESLYEVGWLQKPAGQTRASIPLKTAAESAQEKKEFGRSRFEQAQQAYQQRDLDSALRYIDEADAAEPDQAATLNLRGEILTERKEYDQAEAAFRKALKADSKFREAQYNLAQLPFKKKDYAMARDRFEALIKQTPGGDKNQAAQIIKFKIYLSYLLEGKDSRAQKMMEQFQFTGDTPALYYAQAAWEFKHNNPTKAADWVASAKKIYPSALNNVFADSFYDLGWLQSPAVPGPAPAAEVTSAMAQAESSPAIEPGPLPGTTVATTKPEKQPKTEAPPEPQPEVKAEPKTESIAASSPASALVGWKDVVASEPAPSGASEKTATTLALGTGVGTPATPNEVPAIPAPALSPTVEVSPAAVPPASSTGEVGQPAVAQTDSTTKAAPEPVAASTPATALAPERVGTTVRETEPSTPRSLLVGGLLVAGVFLLAWVIVPELQRRRLVQIPSFHQAAPANGPSIPAMEVEAPVASVAPVTTSGRIAGGPRQVSLQLKASEPSLRRTVLPSGKPVRTMSAAAAAAPAAAPEPVIHRAPEPPAYRAPGPIVEARETETEPFVFESVGPVIEQEPEIAPDFLQPAEPIAWQTEAPEAIAFGRSPMIEPPIEAFHAPIEPTVEPPIEPMAEVGAAAEPATGQVIEPEFEPVSQGQPVPYEMPVWSEAATDGPQEPAWEEQFAARVEPPAWEEPAVVQTQPDAWEEPAVEQTQPPAWDEPVVAQTEPRTWEEPVVANVEPPAWEEPPQRVTVVSEPEPVVDTQPVEPTIISPEPQKMQTSSPLIMPEPIQIPTIRTQGPGTMPQPAGAMQTAVQLTLAFEIASVQLTPTFRMGALQVRPTSKIVTMRLAPSQQPQPAMNLQVTFEIAKIQPAGGALGSVRLTPTQAQRPPSSGSASFTVAGLQLVPNFEAAPVQLTPSGHTASVLVTAPFQITTVEFSPSFEIAAIALTSNSKQVMVQLPGPSPVAGEGAPLFEIANLQLTGNGDIGMMQLNMAGSGLRRA